MQFSSACERVGGRLVSPNVCVVGRNRVEQLDPFNFRIVTPTTRIRVRSAATRTTEDGLLFLFNNCGIEVTKTNVNIKCFTPGKDNDLNVYIEEVLNAVI